MVNQIGPPSMKITGIEISSDVIIFGVCLNRRRSQAARENDTWKWQVGGNVAPHGENDALLCGGMCALCLEE